MPVMLDPFEAMENRVEDWAFDNIKDDKFCCANCKEWTLLKEAIPAGPSPYALPICPKCTGE